MRSIYQWFVQTVDLTRDGDEKAKIKRDEEKKKKKYMCTEIRTRDEQYYKRRIEGGACFESLSSIFSSFVRFIFASIAKRILNRFFGRVCLSRDQAWILQGAFVEHKNNHYAQLGRRGSLEEREQRGQATNGVQGERSGKG